MKRWTLDQMPDQTGRTAVVTGANTGIGFETAAALAVKNASVVLACRSQQKAEDASRVIELANHLFAQTPPMGALPTLRAATDPTAEGGDYYGPKGIYEMRGYPKKAGTTPAAKNELDARRLWQVSEELTGVPFLSLKTIAA